MSSNPSIRSGVHNHPNHQYWKWTVLFLASMVTFGGYYSFDFPSVLHNQLYRHFHDSSPSLSLEDYELSFSLLFSLYSFPNTILPWFGGVLSDKIGNNTVMTICGIFVLFGNILQTYAIMSYNLNLMVFGRFIFGLGAETLQVCTNTTISKWFNGMELAFALGINLSSCKLAGVLTDWISPSLERQGGVTLASIVVTGLCLFCFLMTIILVIYEPKHIHNTILRTTIVSNGDGDITAIGIVTSPSSSNKMASNTSAVLSERQLTTTSTNRRSPTTSSISSSTLYYQIRGGFESSSNSDDIKKKNKYHRIANTKEKKIVSKHMYGQSHQYMEVSDDSVHCADSHWSGNNDIEADNDDDVEDYHEGNEEANDVEMISLYSSHYQSDIGVGGGQRGGGSEDTTITSYTGRRKGGEACVCEDQYDNSKGLNSHNHNNFLSCCWKEMNTVYHEMRRLSSSVWIMMVFTFLMYGTFIPFSNISNAVILEIFFAKSTNIQKSEMTAAWYQSIPYFLTVFLNPPLGLMVDWFGHRTALLVLSAISLTIAHLLIYSASVGAVLPLLMIGLAYSIFGSVIWPCVPVVVEESLHGTAYGTMAAFQNTGQFIMPLVLQQIFRIQHLFRPCEVFLSSTAFCAVLCGLVLYKVDKLQFDGILSKPNVAA